MAGGGGRVCRGGARKGGGGGLGCEPNFLIFRSALTGVSSAKKVMAITSKMRKGTNIDERVVRAIFMLKAETKFIYQPCFTITKFII